MHVWECSSITEGKGDKRATSFTFSSFKVLSLSPFLSRFLALLNFHSPNRPRGFVKISNLFTEEIRVDNALQVMLQIKTDQTMLLQERYLEDIKTETSSQYGDRFSTRHAHDGRLRRLVT